MKNIAVFFGGESVEHDVSVITGVMTVNSLDKSLYNPIPVYVSQSGEWFTGSSLYDLDEYRNLNEKKLNRVTFVFGDNNLYIIKGKKLKKYLPISCAINCMHGERGEDGCLAGIIKTCKIAFASPPMLPSAVSMDKDFTKTVMRALKVKTLNGIVVKSGDLSDIELKKLQYPLIVKPNRLGSSIGVSKVNKEEQLRSAISYALKFGESVVLEPCLEDFTEINCAAYRTADGKITVSLCEKPVGRSKLLSFDDKYQGGERVFPADIPEKVSKKIRETTNKIYLAMGFSGVIRIDYFVVGTEVILNEINTVPGSLAYYLFCQTLSEFSKMLKEMIDVAFLEFAKEESLVKTYSTSILTFGGSKGAKRL